MHLEGFHDSLSNLKSHAFLGLSGRSAQVGRAHHLRPAHQGVVCGWGLLGEHVQSCLHVQWLHMASALAAACGSRCTHRKAGAQAQVFALAGLRMSQCTCPMREVRPGASPSKCIAGQAMVTRTVAVKLHQLEAHAVARRESMGGAMQCTVSARSLQAASHCPDTLWKQSTHLMLRYMLGPQLQEAHTWATCPASIALARAWSSITPPRATLTMRAPFLIFAKASSPKMPCSMPVSLQHSVPSQEAASVGRHCRSQDVQQSFCPVRAGMWTLCL